MFQCKYIVQKSPVKMFIFDRTERHDFMSVQLGLSREDIRSAGSVFHNQSVAGEEMIICSGDSTSLGILSDCEDDKQLFKETFL